MSSQGVNERKIGDVRVAKYSGETEEDIKKISLEYFRGLLKSGAKKIALDLEDVTRFYSLSIGHLVNILKEVEGEGAQLFLINVPDVAIRALASANLLPKFKVYPSEYDFVLDQSVEGASPAEGMDVSYPSSTSFAVTRSTMGQRAVVQVEGALIDADGRKALWDEVRAAMSSGVTEIVLDFEGAEFLDSMALGELVSLYRLCAEKGVVLRAEKVSEVVADAFRVTDLAKLFGIR